MVPAFRKVLRSWGHGVRSQFAIGLIFMLLPACTMMPRDITAPVPPVQPTHVLFVADGAGDYRAASTTIRETAAADGWPLDVRVFVWSHGFMRSIADHTDSEWARERGKELAGVVLAQKQARPDLPVSLVGHSAGCFVVLVAAEQLPPDTLERIVLLSPSVSSGYDVRTALRTTRNGMDVFYSRSDRVFLGAFTALTGTSDDASQNRPAGRFGFEPTLQPGEEGLFTKLRQYEWNTTLEPTGNDGGHYGAYQPGHLRRFVLPLFQY
jgi:pimeloyl-ACP methyl ester carboxylesterase